MLFLLLSIAKHITHKFKTMRQIAIQIGLDLLLAFLKGDRRPNRKLREFLLDERTQNTVADVYRHYVEFVEQNEAADET